MSENGTERTGIEAVKDILQAASGGDPERSESESEGERAELPEEHAVGDDSGPGELDSPERDAADDVEEVAEADEAEGDDIEPVTISSLASELNLDPREVYDIEVPMGKGNAPMTIGQLKDAFKETGPLVEARAKLDEQKDDYEQSIMRTRAELNGIMSVIPQELRQQVIEAGRQYNANWENQQREQVLEAIPDWKDPDVLAKDRDAIVDAGAQYGFSKAEMQYTTDSRTLRMLRDFARMKSRIADMEASGKRERAKPNAPGKQATRKLTKRRLQQRLAQAKASTDMGDKRQAVSYLIGNQ